MKCDKCQIQGLKEYVPQSRPYRVPFWQQGRLPCYFEVLKVAILSLAALCVSWPAMMAGQNLTGGISGTVRDSTGAVVPNATITVENTDRNLIVRTVHTNEQGEFIVPLLNIGHYAITVAASGFETMTESEQVNVGLTVSVEVVLQPGSVSQTVQVTANPLTPQLTSPTAGTLSG